MPVSLSSAISNPDVEIITGRYPHNKYNYPAVLYSLLLDDKLLSISYVSFLNRRTEQCTCTAF